VADRVEAWIHITGMQWGWHLNQKIQGQVLCNFYFTTLHFHFSFWRNCLSKEHKEKCWWLTPVIQEVEIRRILV
jgi:hypothetical protein